MVLAYLESIEAILQLLQKSKGEEWKTNLCFVLHDLLDACKEVYIDELPGVNPRPASAEKRSNLED